MWSRSASPDVAVSPRRSEAEVHVQVLLHTSFALGELFTRVLEGHLLLRRRVGILLILLGQPLALHGPEFLQIQKKNVAFKR